MQKLTRRRFVGAAGAAGVVPLVYVSKAFGAEFTLKYANNSPVTHPLTIFTTKAAERIKADSNGAVEIEVSAATPPCSRNSGKAPSISSRCPA
jgi:TRAP-type C4-dicarboxylate transport system substrate-binding protein